MKWLIRAFAPRTRVQAVLGFLFWTMMFQVVYLIVLMSFSILGTTPILLHMLIGGLACMPFLLISQGMLWHQMHLQRRLSRMARTDQLTDLPNRRRFFELAEALVADTDCALLMVDVDYFKRINDAYGHGAGDVCLQQVAVFLQDTAPNVPCVARLGGEEFALFLSSADLASRKGLPDMLAAGFLARLPGAAAPVRVTVSVGIATCKRGGSLTRTLSRADEALYAAKAAGRCCARRFQDAA